MPAGSPTRRPLRKGFLLFHGVSSLKQWLVQPVLATIVADLRGTKEKALQIKWQFLFLLAPGTGRLGLLRVEPPLILAAFEYLSRPSFGLGHSQLLWAQTYPHDQK